MKNKQGKKRAAVAGALAFKWLRRRRKGRRQGR
jgi:hypothetical protein